LVGDGRRCPRPPWRPECHRWASGSTAMTVPAPDSRASWIARAPIGPHPTIATVEAGRGRARSWRE
jgi:hypothetical protein